MLGFHKDALRLSGPAGTELKTRLLGKYYEFWWKITSGGARKEYKLPTAIVDLNAGSGELYIEETGKTILGSAGHALELKFDLGYSADALKIVLVEENLDCFLHLQNVIRRRWPKVPLEEAMGPPGQNRSGVYLLNLRLNDALGVVQGLGIGNSIFFFDPLLHVEWETIERAARNRITYFYQVGTEFIVFLFTSDWFAGRDYEGGESLAALPTATQQDGWTPLEAETVSAADGLFGDSRWRERILRDIDLAERQHLFVDEYRKRLMKWFRWVLPLPFIPKRGQLYDLMICSNFEDGIKVTRDFYCYYTGNPKYEPSNQAAYGKFTALFPETLRGLRSNQRPLEWKILWHVVRYCEGGVCDLGCRGIKEKGTKDELRTAFRWLLGNEYLLTLRGVPSAWPEIPRYQLNWEKTVETLGVQPPAELRAITPSHLRARYRSRRRLRERYSIR